jgi:hypothetical protein
MAQLVRYYVAEQCRSLGASRDLFDAVIANACVVGKCSFTGGGRKSQGVRVCLPARSAAGKNMQNQR